MKGPEGCINGPADTGTLSELRRGMKDDPGNSVLACTGGPGNFDRTNRGITRALDI